MRILPLLSNSIHRQPSIFGPGHKLDAPLRLQLRLTSAGGERIDCLFPQLLGIPRSVYGVSMMSLAVCCLSLRPPDLPLVDWPKKMGDGNRDTAGMGRDGGMICEQGRVVVQSTAVCLRSIFSSPPPGHCLRHLPSVMLAKSGNMYCTRRLLGHRFCNCPG